MAPSRPDDALWDGGVSDDGPSPRPWGLVDGDTWVLIGDSITAQGLYSDYLEAAIHARYPRMRLTVRGSGVSGDTYLSALARIDIDIAAWRPTVVTLELGMNDRTSWFLTRRNFGNESDSPVDAVVDRVQQGGARAHLFSPSPLDVYPGAGNWVIAAFTEQLSLVSQRRKLQLTDQFATLQPIWEGNSPRDRCARLRRGVAPYLAVPFDTEAAAQPMLDLMSRFLADPTERERFLDAPEKDILFTFYDDAQRGGLDRRNALRTYLAERWVTIVDQANPPFVVVGGDTLGDKTFDYIHPGPVGHLMMAAVLMKQLGADGLASAVTLDAAAGVVVSTEKAQLMDVQFSPLGVSFQRLDAALPFPIAPAARDALAVSIATPLGSAADLFGMSRYFLTVRGLPAGRYHLVIDDDEVAIVDADELARGYQAGLLASGPLAVQGQEILAAVRFKEARAKDEAGDAAIRVAAQPRWHRWSVKR